MTDPDAISHMDKSRIIDIHCHAAGIGAGNSGCYATPRLVRSWRYRLYLKAFGVTAQEAVEQGDALLIRRLSELLAESRLVGSAVVLAMDGVVGDNGEIDFDNTELYVPNEFLASEVRKYGNLLFGASINPVRRDALDRLDRAAADHALLVKWLPSIQLIDPSDRRFIPFYRRMADLGLPLLSHTGAEYSFSRARGELADPARLRLALEQGVTVIAAHAATNGSNEGEPDFRRLLPMFGQFPNLYADISSLTQIHKVTHIPMLMRHPEIHDRLINGTDMPLPNTAAVSPFYFIHKFGLKKCMELHRIKNPWDQDTRIKLELGVPAEVFGRAASLLSHRPD